MNKSDKLVRAVLDRQIRGSSRVTLKDHSPLREEDVMAWLKKEGFPSLTHRASNGHSVLHAAASRGRIGVLHWILKNTEMEVTVRTTTSGFTPLHVASIRNHERTARWLVSEANAPVEVESAGSTTVIMCAAHSGNINLMKFFLSKGAVLQSRSKPIVAVAAAKGHLEAVKWLHSQGCELDAVSPTGTSAVMHAAVNGHKRVLEWLAKKNCDLMRSNESGDTALSWAAEKGRIKVVKWLVKRGASLTQHNKTGSFPFSLAASNGHLEVMEFLVKKGSPMKSTCEKPERSLALVSASKNGHLEAVKWLTKQGVSPNVRDTMGQSPVEWAVEKGHLEILKYFIEECKVPIEQSNTRGKTLAMFAAQFNQIATLRYIYSVKPELLCELDNNGTSAAGYAVENRHFSVLQWLVGHGCMIGGDTGMDPTLLISLATKTGNLGILQFVYDCGAPINALDASGFSPAMHAARCGRLDMIKWLYAHGANLNSRTKLGSTLLMVATINGHVSMVAWLLKHGCSVVERNLAGRDVLACAREYSPAVLNFLQQKCGFNISPS
jgi:ankyrin repeat protein